MLDRVSKMSRELDKFEEEKEEYFGPIAAAFEAEKENETKEEYFERVLKNSTNMDRVLEFLIFKREADKLLPTLRDELVDIVRVEFRIDEALVDLKLERRMAAREGTRSWILLVQKWAKVSVTF